MSSKQIKATASIDSSPPCLKSPSANNEWGWFIEHDHEQEGDRLTLGGGVAAAPTTTGMQHHHLATRVPPADGRGGGTKGGDATLSESLLLLCNKNMIGLMEFRDKAEFQFDQHDQTTLPTTYNVDPGRRRGQPRPPNGEINAGDTTTIPTMNLELGPYTLAGNDPDQDLNLLMFEPLPPMGIFDIESDALDYGTKNSDDSGSCTKEAHTADDGDDAVVVVKKRKRGKDLSSLLHRRAQYLETKEATFQSREAAIENKAQSILHEIKRQDGEIRRREGILLNRERLQVNRERDVQAMQMQLWLDRQKSIQQQQDDDCFICFERPIDCILVPCGHLVACMGCVTKMNGVCCICQQRSRPQKIYRTLT